MRAQRFAFAATVLLMAGAVILNADDDVTANNPLIAPYFSVDRHAQEVTGGLLLPGDVLLPTGPNEPVVEIPAADFMLFDPNDDVDALALGGWGVSIGDTFVLIFSVDAEAVGGVAPDGQVTALGYPFNVQDQAAKEQAPGDAFMSLELFDRLGEVPPPTRSRASNSTLVINQGDAGGVDFKVHPKKLSPSNPKPLDGTSASNVNAAAGTQAQPHPALRDTARRQVPDWILFSLAAGSPSLPTMPGGNGSPADIYVDLNPDTPGGEELFVGPLALGLTLSDDIDALIVFDDGDRAFTSGSDQIIFSLAPGSPSLGSFGPGDLFSSEGFAVFTLYCSADQLGLDSSDNLDMLDYVLSSHVLTSVCDWGIGHMSKCTGDINGDGFVDMSDLGILLPAYNHCEGDYEYYPGADIYGNDGCVDLSDLGELLPWYGTACP